MDKAAFTSRNVWSRGAYALSLGVALYLLMATAPVVQEQVHGQQNVRLNSLIAKLEEGKQATTGAGDWMMIDLEHNPYLLDRLESTLAGMKKTAEGRVAVAPLVRIPLSGDEDFKWVVKQVLDSGVFGIVFPHIETKEEAEKAVRSMRYPPQRGTTYPAPIGERGWYSARAAKLWGISEFEYLRRADVWPLNPEGELFAVLMIESAKGVKNINEILEVPGIGSTLIGPNDLGVSLGVGPRRDDYAPETEAAIQTVLKACKAKNVRCGTGVVGGDSDYKKRLAEGWQVIVGGGRPG